MKYTARKIKMMKGREKIICLTAYDYSAAALLDDCGVHLLLVGDSLGMTMLGYSNTLPVTMDEMLHHTAAVSRGVTNALVVADMPFMSFQVSDDEAFRNACRFIKEAGAGAVKIEGGAVRHSTIKRLVTNGIPVLGHIGLTPQSLREMGGYRVQGRLPQEAQTLLDDAAALEDAGVFAIVLECIPPALAADITSSVVVPTIGIGAGAACDGQILVTHDMLGMTGKVAPRFVKRYADLDGIMRKAVADYTSEVSDGQFPADEHCYQ